jgi:hypothetical protein
MIIPCELPFPLIFYLNFIYFSIFLQIWGQHSWHPVFLLFLQWEGLRMFIMHFAGWADTLEGNSCLCVYVFFKFWVYVHLKCWISPVHSIHFYVCSGKFLFRNDHCEATIGQVANVFWPNGMLCSLVIFVGTYLLG